MNEYEYVDSTVFDAGDPVYSYEFKMKPRLNYTFCVAATNENESTHKDCSDKICTNTRDVPIETNPSLVSFNIAEALELKFIPSDVNKSLVLGITAALLSTILIVILVYVKLRRIRNKNLTDETETKSSTFALQNFENGNISCFNPALTLDEQADLLPYDRKFEFPKENLQLGQQLGNGAFGVVFEATAKGIVAGEEETTVAVKTVKSIAGDEVCFHYQWPIVIILLNFEWTI